MTQEEMDAIDWIHETVGDRLSGDATRKECIDFIRRNGTSFQKRKLSKVLDILGEDECDA